MYVLPVTHIVNVNNQSVSSLKVSTIQENDVDGGQVEKSRENIVCTTAQQNIHNVYVLPVTDIVNVNNQSVSSLKVLMIQENDVDGGQVEKSRENIDCTTAQQNTQFCVCDPCH